MTSSAVSSDGRYRAPPIGLAATAVIPVFLIALPVLYLVLRAGQVGLAGVWTELARARTLGLLLNTVVLAASVTLCSTVIGVAVAWAVERTALPGRGAWRVMAGLPLAVPAFVSSYTWSSLSGAFEGMAGAIFILSLSSYPLVYLPVAAALRGIDSSLEDVSRSLGSGVRKTFIRVILPQLQPALGAGALLVLTHMLAEFGALSLLRVQTFTTAIFESYQLQFDNASAALLSVVLMALCLPAAYAEMRVRGSASLLRVGRGSARVVPLAGLGHWKLPVLASLLTLVAAALAVPAVTLVYWLVQGQSLGRGYADIWPAIQGSFELAVPGAFFTTLLALPLVLLATRYRGRLSSLVDRLPYVVHGLPGLVVALALVFLSLHVTPFLYQSAVVLFIAYGILFLPLAQSALRASVELAPARIEEVARSLGRGPLRAFVSITLPAIAPGIGAALALMTLELMRELTATLMLAPTGVVTLATEVWSHTNDAEYAAAAPFAALLVLVSAIPVYIFTRRTLTLYDAP